MWPNAKFPAVLATLTEEILNKTLYFLCSAVRCWCPLFLVYHLELLVCYLEQQLKKKGPLLGSFRYIHFLKILLNNLENNSLKKKIPYKKKLPRLLKTVTL